jgi:Tol biopolymer transport system component
VAALAQRLPGAPLVALTLLCTSLLAAGCGSVKSEVRGVELVEQPGASLAAWSPDSRWIAVPLSQGIGLHTPDGAKRQRIQAPPIRTYFGSPTPIEWSRDGQWLRYVTSAGPERGHGLWATQVRRDGGGLKQTPLETELAFPAWAPGGWPLVFATGPFEFEPDGSRSGPAAALRVLPGPGTTPKLLARTTGIPEDPVVSPGAQQVLYKQWLHHHTELWALSANGSEQRRLARFLYLRHYECSPDGERIAFAATPRHGSEGGRLFIVAAAGGKPRPVGDEVVVDGPSWTPDGRWLTFSNRDGEIRRIHPDGSSNVVIADFEDEEVRGLAWSPNGHYLLYSANPFPSEYSD